MRNRHSVRNTSGKFATSDAKQTRFDLWNMPGVKGFENWLADVKPKVLTQSNEYKVFKPTTKQKEVLQTALAVDNGNNFMHSLVLLIWPRRHGKSTVFALICLWLFTSRQNITVQLLGNHEIHCRRVQFRTLERIIRHTPRLRKLIPDKYIITNEIKYPARGNVIQVSTTNASGSFGDKLDVLWVSDFHACPDLEPFNAFQAALLDSDNSIILIDSNVDHTDGHVHSLQLESVSDTTIFCDHIEYKDFDLYTEEAPPWINRTKAKRLKSTILPTEFSRDILGKRLDAQNALFPFNVIELCKSKYKTPVTDISELTKGRSYRVGGGLDRSKSLFGGDNTVWTVILKVASPEHGEPEFYLLNQEVIIPNTSKGIKKAILRDHQRYGLNNVVLENYEVTDIGPWLTDQRIQFELVSAHDTNQNASFPEFFRIAKEGRFNFPESLKGLASEMATFTYTQKTGGKYSFGHARSNQKDDRVYSVNWAIFSLRQSILNLYVLGNIVCRNKSARRHMCFLMGGSMKLLCSEQCQTYKEVEAMFKDYKTHMLDSELAVEEFYEAKVKLEGARVYQAA